MHIINLKFVPFKKQLNNTLPLWRYNCSSVEKIAQNKSVSFEQLDNFLIVH